MTNTEPAFSGYEEEPMTKDNEELKPCPFKRGQVWENEDGALMEFHIKHRITGGTIFTAEIEANKETAYSVKLGLAVTVAITQGADLRWADLRGAYLRDTNLREVDLRWANLKRAHLREADLREANLQGACLQDAELQYTELQYACLEDADLRGADLRGADLHGADLYRSNLRFYISDIYACYINPKTMQIGWENHTWEDWLSFDDKRIIAMDSREALTWWRANKPILELIRKSIE